MTVRVGDKIPSVDLKTMGSEGTPQTVNTGELLGSGKVVLFAVPGAFTRGCSKVHLPGFVQNAEALKAKGVRTIACVAVNDPWVMQAWADSQDVGDRIVMLADGSGDFATAMGMELDMRAHGLGWRSKRYAAIVEDGVITSLDVDENSVPDASTCPVVLSKL